MSISNNMKHYRCCVPDCETYDTSENFLHFPADCRWRQQWLAALPIKNLVIDHNTVLCLKHFSKEDVVLYTHVQDSQGNIQEVREFLPLIKEGAVPSLFPEQTYEPSNGSPYWPDMMFEVAARDDCPQTFGDLENCADSSDYLLDIHYLKRMYHIKLKDFFPVWNVMCTQKYILFYTIDECQSVPRIATSIKIDEHLILTLTLDGKEMDKADLTWIIPVTGKVNRWSQVKVLLEHFEKGRSVVHNEGSSHNGFVIRPSV